MLNRDKLAKIKTYDDFFEVRQAVASLSSTELFNSLFPISIENIGDSADSFAGLLLIELDPKHELTLENMLLKIAKSKWNVSNREIPFYLVSQFGKWNVLNKVNELLKDVSFNEEEKNYLETVNYWASGPPSGLSEPLHYFEWQEVIERKNAEQVNQVRAYAPDRQPAPRFVGRLFQTLRNNEISKKEFIGLLSEGKTFILHFWAEWNGYDIEQKNTISKFRDKYPNIGFFEMDVDVKENHDICQEHEVFGPPTIVFYKNGKLINRIVGLLKESQLESELQSFESA